MKMKHLFKGVCLWLMCLMLLMPAAMAEDCFTIDVDALDMGRLNSDDYVARHLSAGAQGLRVRKYLSSSSEVACAVRLTVTQMNTQTLLFDKNYGYQTGVFDSGVLYLPYASDGTVPYLITLYVGETVYGIPFMHRQSRLESNGACTVGVRLRDLDPAQSGDWLMGTMVDLNELRYQGSRTVDVCASNSYVVGTATISLNGSQLSVQMHFDRSANVSVQSAQLYVLTDGQYLKDARSYASTAGVDVSGASSALVYLPMEISYDPSGLPLYRYDLGTASYQQQLWKESRGTYSQQAAPSVSNGSTGWNDSWSGGWDDGWSSGW